ncbi:MAG: D-alanyl-D-alanine carboxypeptidase/D-alanyl-D-alanine-endopeptidase [Deltaproteobacteria bacterium]
MNVQNRIRSITILLLFIFAFACAENLPAQPPRAPKSSNLSRRIESLLRKPEARRGFWGIIVAQLPGGRVLYERNSDQLFQPASNMKLFTTAAALELLGADFVFRTTVESDALPGAAGRVRDLILVGRGDPNISSRDLPYQYDSPNNRPADAVLQELAEKVKARGVQEVTGDIVADDRYFLFEPFSHDWSVEDLQWGYGAPITALAYNDNALRLYVSPGERDGTPAKIRLEPIGDYYHLNNRLETSAAGTERQVFVERLPGSMMLDVWGEIPVGTMEDYDTVAIADPPRLAGELFKHALESRGIKVGGGVKTLELTRVEAAGQVNPFAPSPGRVVLADHQSIRLSEEVKIIDKVSQNLHAEMLLRTLAREKKKFGSLTVGLEILQEFAGEIGIDPGAVQFADGSGLSREALVTPRAIVKLLVHMDKSPQAKIYFDALPIAGVDGTLAKRFRRSRAGGKIHAKTGTINHVNTLSGYMQLPSGRKLAFSALADNHEMSDEAALKTLDAVALAIYDAYGGRARAPAKRKPARK